jgi:hypothetical protein
MPKKQYTTIGDMLQEAKDDIAAKMDLSSSKSIPDIVTFCEDQKYLGLRKCDEDGNEIANLYPMQMLILKVFYRGTLGNEDLVLTDEDIELLKELNLEDNDHGDVLGKYNSKAIFRELVLVWGRRSGKTFLFSIIALYEAMKLLETPGGDPNVLYRLGGGAEISILTVAMSSDQAHLAFLEIREKLLHSKYFEDKFMRPDGITADSIYLLTPKDKKDNEDCKKKNIPQKKGSIVIEVGHSNSSTLRGKSIFVLLFDEIAAYKTTSGPSSDENIYASLIPSVNTYFRIFPALDKDGNQKVDERGKKVFDKIFDGKIICISTPMGKEGKLYDLYSKAPAAKHRLTCRLSTWDVNPFLTEDDLRANADLPEDKFMQEYGAEFSGTAGENFFPRECVEEIFKKGYSKKMKTHGEPGTVYFAHLDPASTSHNYALAIVHKELSYNKETKQIDFRVVVDHLKYWQPLPNKPINVDMVDEYLIKMKSFFFFGLVTYDQWNSASSIQKVRKHGLPAKCTRFNNRFKMAIYDELYNLVVGGKIVIPYNDLLMNEMINLQRKMTPTGWRVGPKKAGGTQTDDCVDALAGACYHAVQATFNRLPTGQIVATTNGTAGRRMWNSMQGPIGYGTGREVSSNLERLKSWPSRLR